MVVKIEIPVLDFHEVTVWLKEHAPGARYSSPKHTINHKGPCFQSTVTNLTRSEAILLKLTYGGKA